MMSCVRATERMSRALDQQLSPMDRLQLRIHTLMCKDCLCCHKQLIQLHNICQKRSTFDSDSDLKP